MTKDSKTLPRLVIVDDEQEILNAIKRSLMRNDVDIVEFSSPRLALAYIQENEPDMVISDQRMPDISGIELLAKVKQLWPQTQRIMLSAFQEFDLVLQGFNEQIIDRFIAKPWKNKELQFLVADINKTTTDNKKQLTPQLIGEHPLMQTLIDNVSKAAGANVPIFIHGETGTGKELVAKACHELGCKRLGQFIAVNCANFSEQLIESQLFGHKKGAFTGAVAEQKGIFEHADGGTIFLDEITTLPLNLQSKLLRVIQERVYSPLGSIELKHFDAQIVSASSTSLAEAVNQGAFRQDLYYRLSVIPVRIPPLRDRGEDILRLAQHFLTRYSKQYQKQFVSFSPGCEQFIKQYAWPGNVRQLENVIHGLCVLNDSKQVTVQMLQGLIDNCLTQRAADDYQAATDVPIAVDTVESAEGTETMYSLAAVEKQAIEKALASCDGNVNKAANLLKVNPSTLYRKIKQWQQ